MQKLYTMRGQIYLLLTAMAISAVLILVSAAKGIAHDRTEAAMREASRAETVGFVLGEYEGKLALYREHSAKPYQVLEMETYLLSEEDRTALQTGILVGTEEELWQLLEDWDS